MADELGPFRSEVRQWLEANCPDALKAPMPPEEYVSGGRKAVYHHPDAKLWLDRMAEKGWTVPTWPREYGGAGLSKEEAGVLAKEMGRLGCRPPLVGMGPLMLGPTLLKFGSETQKQEHLPKIARGEIRWCQGYSEPNAGSDLAGLQARAEEQDGHYLVNGSKLWTSNADLSDWMFCLVRTDSAAKKHAGISLILFDLEEEGITISPIELISGASIFFEMVLENLRVPKENLVGEPNAGWGIAKYLLTHERSMISGIGHMFDRRTTADVAKQYLGEENGRVADAVFRDRIAKQDMDDHAFALTMARYTEQVKQGEGPGHASAMFKYTGTENAKNKMELMVAAGGTQALGWEGTGFSDSELELTRSWLRSKGFSIEGGTSEIMLNILATRVLGLPKG